MQSEALDNAGVHFMRVRDNAVAALIAVLDGEIGAPDAQEFRHSASSLTPEARRRIVEAVDTVLHTLLVELEADQRAEFRYDGRSIEEVSDGLGGELFGEHGWVARFSRYTRSF